MKNGTLVTTRLRLTALCLLIFACLPITNAQTTNSGILGPCAVGQVPRWNGTGFSCSTLFFDVTLYKQTGDPDDTASIIRALAAMSEGAAPAHAFLTYNSPALYFPPGRYLLSKAIDVAQKVKNIMGDGALIEQTTNDSDIFTTSPNPAVLGTGQVYFLTVKGLTFVGGRHALRLTSGNLADVQ